MSVLELSQLMTGSLTVGWSNAGRNGFGHNDADSPVAIVLTVRIDDLDEWLAGPGRTASVRGMVDAPVLAAGPLSTEGSIRWYADDPEQVPARRMDYDLTLRSATGCRYFVDGYRVTRTGPFGTAWPEASTLRITVRDAYRAVIAQGTLTGRPRDVSIELSSVRITGSRGEAETLDGLTRFGRRHAGALFDYYGGISARPAPLEPNAAPRRTRPLRCPLPEIHDLLTPDGLRLRLLRYRGGSRGPVVCVHGMGASSGVFTADTVAPNLTEYLCRHGFDVWLLDWRASTPLTASAGPHTADASATNDFPAAAELIRQTTGFEKLHWIAHCAGSMVLFMSALSGLDGIASVISLQGGLYPHTPPLDEVRIGLHVPGMLERLGIGADDAWQDRVFALADREFPLPPNQRCASVACHRISCLYSLNYQHENLNQLTHATMHERMGVANLALLRQLADCAARGRLVDAKGADAYLPNLDRLRIPITFIHGERNRVWTAESSTRSYAALRSRFGDGLYRQHVLPDCGNLDVLLGTAGATRSYPLILQHLSRQRL